MNTLKREAERALQGECMAQRGLSEGELEMDRRRWERRVLTLLSMKSINSLNHRDWSYIRRIKGLIMLTEITFKLFEELNTKNRIYQENHAKD